MLKDSESYLDYLCNWELSMWCVALAVFLMRFMTVGLKINKKYRNLSVLITEQVQYSQIFEFMSVRCLMAALAIPSVCNFAKIKEWSLYIFFPLKEASASTFNDLSI